MFFLSFYGAGLQPFDLFCNVAWGAAPGWYDADL